MKGSINPKIKEENFIAPNMLEKIFQCFPPSVIPYDYGFLSHNPNITWDMITKYETKGWDWQTIFQNEQKIREKKYKTPVLEWSKNTDNFEDNYNIETFRKFKDTFYANREELSRSPYITMKNIKNNSDLPWDTRSILLNPNLDVNTLYDILKNNLVPINEVGVLVSKNKFYKDPVLYRKGKRRWTVKREKTKKFLLEKTHMYDDVIHVVLMYI